MPKKSSAPKGPPRLGRTGWTVLIAIVLLAVFVGIWPLMGPLTAYVPALAVPAAFGLPYLIPPLRLTPLGLTTWSYWWADTIAVAVMVLTAWAMLRARGRKHPHPGFWRAFGQGLWVTTVAVIAGNIVRGVWLSFATQSTSPTFLSLIGIGLIVSLIEGLLVGIVPGLAAGIVALTYRRPAPNPAPDPVADFDPAAESDPAPNPDPASPLQPSTFASADDES